MGIKLHSYLYKYFVHRGSIICGGAPVQRCEGKNLCGYFFSIHVGGRGNLGVVMEKIHACCCRRLEVGFVK